MPEWLAIGLAVVALLGFIVLAYASLIERNWYHVREVSLRVLPAGSEPIRVLHLSDFHFRGNQRKKKRWLSSLSNLKPDLVVNTGDNLGARNSVLGLEEALKSLSQTPGVFVNGSNDYTGPSFRNPFAYLSGPSEPASGIQLETDELEAAFERLGWQNLNNRNARMVVAGQQLDLIGVDDPHIGRADFTEAVKGLAAAPVASTDMRPTLRIGLAHAPYLDVLNKFAELDANLVFAGHTHGGQVCLPGGRALVTNCDLPPKNAKGVSAWQFGERTLVLHVCAGLGTSVLAPFRLFCPPEVALVELLPTT